MSDKNEQADHREFLQVCVGERGRGFAEGDFLNAVDELACYFDDVRTLSDDGIARALRMYALHREGGKQ